MYDFGKNKKKFFWISHQHGHGIELSEIHKKYQITKEETLSDLLFVYSSMGKKTKEKNKYIKSKLKFSMWVSIITIIILINKKSMI